MENLPELRKETIPGIGFGGVVMCPYFKGACLKSGCELWVELNYGENKVARCSVAWQSILLVEQRQEIEKLRKTLDEQARIQTPT